jgi:hypothetical protein
MLAVFQLWIVRKGRTGSGAFIRDLSAKVEGLAVEGSFPGEKLRREMADGGARLNQDQVAVPDVFSALLDAIGVGTDAILIAIEAIFHALHPIDVHVSFSPDTFK